MTRPLTNISLKLFPDSSMRVYADVAYGQGEPVRWYAEKTLRMGEEADPEAFRNEIGSEAIHGCMDLLSARYGDGLHGPWQKVFWAFQHDIRRQVRRAKEQLVRGLG